MYKSTTTTYLTKTKYNVKDMTKGELLSHISGLNERYDQAVTDRKNHAAVAEERLHKLEARSGVWNVVYAIVASAAALSLIIAFLYMLVGGIYQNYHQTCTNICIPTA